MATSYDKVSALYCATPDWKYYQETVRKRLLSLHISTFAYEIREAEDIHNPRPYFRYKYDGAVREESVWRSARHEVPNLAVDWDHVNPMEEMVQFARTVWGKKTVPTYFCKLEKNPKGPKDQNYLLNHFPSFARAHLAQELAREHADASSRIRDAIVAWYDAPDASERKAKAVERKAIEEIKGALLRYRHLDQDILVTAFREFVAEDVLSC